MEQNIIVALISAAAVAYIVYRARKSVRGGACGCGCAGCGNSGKNCGENRLTKLDTSDE